MGVQSREGAREAGGCIICALTGDSSPLSLQVRQVGAGPCCQGKAAPSSWSPMPALATPVPICSNHGERSPPRSTYHVYRGCHCTRGTERRVLNRSRACLFYWRRLRGALLGWPCTCWRVGHHPPCGPVGEWYVRRQSRYMSIYATMARPSEQAGLILPPPALGDCQSGARDATGLGTAEQTGMHGAVHCPRPTAC